MPYGCSKYSLKIYIFIYVKSLNVVVVNQSKAYIAWRPNNNSQKPVIVTVYINSSLFELKYENPDIV